LLVYAVHLPFFFLMIPLHLRFILFPYTTLFRSMRNDWSSLTAAGSLYPVILPFLRFYVPQSYRSWHLLNGSDSIKFPLSIVRMIHWKFFVTLLTIYIIYENVRE